MEQVKHNQKQYNKTFMDKEKGKKYICKECDKEYSYYAKSAHIKSKYHQLAKKLNDKYAEEELKKYEEQQKQDKEERENEMHKFWKH
jgi:hypothetical protein